LAYDGEVVVVLPHGVEAQALPLATACLAVAAPREGFSTGLAMERNALIYAGVELTVVVHARYRAGGSWHGAADALRRRLGRVAVPSPMLHHPGIRALHALGAEALVAPAALAEALGQPPRTLFPPEAFAEAVSASSPLQVAPPLV
jgi:predicted Rossmann fold nucleotide-binding protein DprA/Smf involved in DNA uptake